MKKAQSHLKKLQDLYFLLKKEESTWNPLRQPLLKTISVHSIDF